MQQEKNNTAKKNKHLAVLFWVLSCVCFVLIFYFSSRTRSESSLQSAFFVALLRKVFGTNFFTDFIVRKGAHLLEYAGTALMLSAAYYFSLNKNKLYLPLITASLYAVTDEIHQIIVPGRACQLRDWVIDTAGAILGIAIYYLIYSVIKRIKLKHPGEDKI